MDKQTYTDYHITEFPKDSGVFYKFDPHVMGQGFWREVTKKGSAGKVVSKDLQREINSHFFGARELPSMYERFMKSSVEERNKLKEISLGWLALKIKGIKENIPNQEFTGKQQFVSGGLYFYVYDPKTKNKLPIWDRFPLVILLKTYGNNKFLGLNIHYLPMEERMKFLSKLMNTKKSDDPLLLNISYEYLNGSQKFSEFKSCIKMYLTTHVTSKILPIESHEWVLAAGLNIQQFNKK